MGNHHNFNKNFIHHQKSRIAGVLKEVVFGIEDGMVSTLGSITGIAVGSKDQATVLLAGSVIIAVESISMGIGSYLSNKSEEEMDARKIKEEMEENEKFPNEEKQELLEIYKRDGWSEELASKMTEFAVGNKKLMLQEMKLRELKIVNDEESTSIKGGVYMFFAYIFGGLIPLCSYFLLPIKTAIPISIAVTLTGLFILGMGTTRFTKQPIFKSGLRILIMGGIALVAGLAAGLLIGE
ncbi:MAG: VIT1/CCC1 transporter family protein [Candidatus Pacebacteria bacterium]|nr:VIT1/CCC1 transporter family protein [Candidatus Paceibacterota bacterium]